MHYGFNDTAHQKKLKRLFAWVTVSRPVDDIKRQFKGEVHSHHCILYKFERGGLEAEVSHGVVEFGDCMPDFFFSQHQ